MAAKSIKSISDVMNREVKTLVFFDLESTTLIEINPKKPRIIELFMLAVGRGQFLTPEKPRVLNSLRLAFSPNKPIPLNSSHITGKKINFSFALLFLVSFYFLYLFMISTLLILLNFISFIVYTYLILFNKNYHKRPQTRSPNVMFFLILFLIISFG